MRIGFSSVRRLPRTTVYSVTVMKMRSMMLARLTVCMCSLLLCRRSILVVFTIGFAVALYLDTLNNNCCVCHEVGD